ncbi:MAG: hypothetical protein PVI66_15365 [Candidatus Aminicenantes bacterium]|jgi:hypothetical protein
MNKRHRFFFAMIFVLSALLMTCAPKDKEKRNDMKMIVETLQKENIELVIMGDADKDSLVIVPKFGARILAACLGGKNLFWTHPDVLSGQGGQRSWVSPEGGDKGFLFKPDWTGNRDFSMMDPGNYMEVEWGKKRHSFQNSFLVTSNDGAHQYDLTLTRAFDFLEDPLLGSADFEGADYQYMGIDFNHALRNNSEEMLDRILDLWCLIQVPPKGTMVVPVEDVSNEAWRGNYFEPVPEKYVKANPDSFSYFIHGSRRYKVGVRPESSKGVIGYIFDIDKGIASLVFMTFPVEPEGRYVDRPKVEQATNGDAIQIYSHLEEGPLAFGELECHSWGLKLEPDGEEAFPIKIHLYRAPLDVLKKIGSALICPEFDGVYLFNPRS